MPSVGSNTLKEGQRGKNDKNRTQKDRFHREMWNSPEIVFFQLLISCCTLVNSQVVYFFQWCLCVYLSPAGKEKKKNNFRLKIDVGKR